MLVRWRGHHPRALPPAKVRVLINDSDSRLCRALFSFVTHLCLVQITLILVGIQVNAMHWHTTQLIALHARIFSFIIYRKNKPKIIAMFFSRCIVLSRSREYAYIIVVKHNTYYIITIIKKIREIQIQNHKNYIYVKLLVRLFTNPCK